MKEDNRDLFGLALAAGNAWFGLVFALMGRTGQKDRDTPEGRERRRNSLPAVMVKPCPPNRKKKR